MWLYLENTATNKEKLLFAGLILNPDMTWFELRDQRCVTRCDTQFTGDPSSEYHLHFT